MERNDLIILNSSLEKRVSMLITVEPFENEKFAKDDVRRTTSMGLFGLPAMDEHYEKVQEKGPSGEIALGLPLRKKSKESEGKHSSSSGHSSLKEKAMDLLEKPESPTEKLNL